MKRYAIAFLLCLVAVILVWLYVTKIDQASHIEKKYIDKVRLHSITIAIDLYVAKNDSLPQDEKVRELLVGGGFIDKEDVFYSRHGGKIFRYYSHGEKYVLVSPGENGKYDSPQGYENLKEFKEKTDDIIQFENIQ